ncbi:hypothetical protein L211DRAFT_898129 [Terfezia boudieri ATCC MYA-4762]|uniref:Uncharacterized protein n=1 Tax=Terfezia boudieri ATCC MYA-4762 TaxID=1051890 RepID=A0A3N4L8W0_9PEZI|nr:hypothetical protein L211DRAFT_898129 [Terfezia boudieri ATCC MYA-4762]
MAARLAVVVMEKVPKAAWLNDENGRLVERNEKLYNENLRLKSNLESNLADTSESSNLILVGRVVYDDILRLDKQKLDKLDSALRNIRDWFLSTSVGYVSAGIEGHRRFIMLFQSLGVRYLAMVEATIGSWEEKWSAFENKSLGCLDRLEGLLENRIWWANHEEARWFAICFVDTLRALLKLRGIEK